MVLDFGDLKSVMTDYVHDVFDHGFIVYEEDFEMREALSHLRGEYKIIVVDFIPTAENLAEHIWHALTGLGFNNITDVIIYETPTSMAAFKGENNAKRNQVSRSVDEDNYPR